MATFFLMPFAAAFSSIMLAFAPLVRRHRSPAAWCFFAGMAGLGVDSFLTGFALHATAPEQAIRWLAWSFVVKSFVGAVWLGFSLTYSRGNYAETVARWRIVLIAAALLPVAALVWREHLVHAAAAEGAWQLQAGVAARVLNVPLLVALVLILMNLEQTFRSAIGTMRWRIKFVVLALAVIFSARVYVRIQAILFSAPDIAFWGFESGALLIGCLFLAVAYARTELAEIDVYPSLAVLRSSLTVLIVGAYLLVVGVLAQVVARVGGAEIFQFQALVVLLGMSGLAVLLLSDRARQTMHATVARHFRKAQHDSVQVWTLFSRRLAAVKDQDGLCAAAAKLIAETFEVLSVTIWLLDADGEELVLAASTSRSGEGAGTTASSAVMTGLRSHSSPFDLETIREPWAEELRQLNSMTFTTGGNRLCVPLQADDQHLGALVLADRVNGAPYTVEELELLNCIGAQVTSVLVGLRLATEVARARELEALRTMSAFFVHDLKNAAASLNLMLKNLPRHFDDPQFREDALRGVGNAARRIDDIIARLSTMRQCSETPRVPADLNQLVAEALDRVSETPEVRLSRAFQPLPPILADAEQLQSVVTNLVLNARDAVEPGGRIAVGTHVEGDRVILSVADDGCGMNRAFVRDSLFRPFQSSKKKGFGIGLFQSRAIVRAHGGGMQVESEAGKGTTILVSLPVMREK